MSIEELIQFTKRLYISNESIEEVIQTVQLNSKRRDKIKNLSYSERKRVQLACLLIQNPTICIFEEPDQNLDLESKRIFLAVIQKLKQDGRSIFILTGNMESAVTAADEIFRLDENGLYSIHTEADEESNGEIENSSSPAESIIPVRFEKIPTEGK